MFLKTFLALLFVSLFVGSPLQGENYDSDVEIPYEVVDLVQSESGELTACPDVSRSGLERPCLASGVVEMVRIEQGSNREWLVVSVGGEIFYYLSSDPDHGDLGAAMNLFTVSKLNQTAVSLRYKNWDGEFYITEASF